jgi:ubiquinone/menaquinone biosynthesis C-methylase UbiE
MHTKIISATYETVSAGPNTSTTSCRQDDLIREVTALVSSRATVMNLEEVYEALPNTGDFEDFVGGIGTITASGLIALEGDLGTPAQCYIYPLSLGPTQVKDELAKAILRHKEMKKNKVYTRPSFYEGNPVSIEKTTGSAYYLNEFVRDLNSINDIPDYLRSTAIRDSKKKIANAIGKGRINYSQVRAAIASVLLRTKGQKSVLLAVNFIKSIFKPIFPGLKAYSGNEMIVSPELRKIYLEWADEMVFWDSYGKIYPQLEQASPYRQMRDQIRMAIDPRKDESWLDVGCGPAFMSKMIHEVVGGKITVTGIDFSYVMLEHARRELDGRGFDERIGYGIKLMHGDLDEGIPLRDNSVNGIVGNLVVPYLKDYKGFLQDAYRVLKPNGLMVFSTPINNVQFYKVFLASWKEILSTPANMVYGPLILANATVIQKKGSEGKYHFLEKTDWEDLLHWIGFYGIEIIPTFAGQALVIKMIKPAHTDQPQ